MRIIIPCAGEGRRFAEAGYYQPKPMIDVAGKPMIQRVIDCLRTSPDDEATVISRIDLPGIDAKVELLYEPTQGAADTLLQVPLGKEPVMVANCDQFITISPSYFLRVVEDCSAGVMVFNSTNPHHSYVRTDRHGLVKEIAEKRVISDLAVLGVYWFQSGWLLQDYAEEAIKSAERLNGEVYISSILGLMVREDKDVATFEVDVHDKHMLGTPEELRIFLDKVQDGRVVL